MERNTALSLLVLSCVGCAGVRGYRDVPVSLRADSANPLPRVYDRHAEAAARTFRHALFFKPGADSDVEDELSLAPLIVLEVSGDSGAAPRAARFGSLRREADGRVVVMPDDPVVYHQRGTTTVRGRRLVTRTFCWYDAPNVCASGSIRGHQLRIVFDREGYPIVFDVARIAAGAMPTDEPRTLYVSESFEQAARAAFGPPLPGRRFSAERSRRDAPRSLVVGVLDDGPTPMGPYVYIEARDCLVTTLLCRCSPSQMDDVVESVDYRLVPFDDVRAAVDEAFGSGGRRPRDGGAENLNPPLSDALRWPTSVIGPSVGNNGRE